MACVVGVLLVACLVASAAATDPPVSGAIFAFGKVHPKRDAVPLDSKDKNEILESKRFRAASAGPHALGLITPDEGGTAWRLDDVTSFGALTSPVHNEEQWCQICKGDIHTVAVTCRGHAYTWGGRSNLPDPDGPLVPGILARKLMEDKVIQISCARNHTLLLTETRDVYVFGATSDHRLGADLDPSVSTQFVPVKLESLSLGQLLGNDTVCYVNAGGRSSYAITERGDMFVWGANEVGQLGTGEKGDAVKFPTMINSKLRACEVSAGDSFVIAYDQEGKLWSWGANTSTPTLFGTERDTATWASTLDVPVMMLATGEFHTAMLLANGSVFTLGYNRFGQLGVELPGQQGTVDQIWTLKPQLVAYLEGKNISSIFASGNYTVAHQFIKSPMNCPCAQGGRVPTKLSIPGAIPIYREPSIPLPQQPEYEPSNLFGPVAPNKMKPRLKVNPPLPNEVVRAVPQTMDERDELHVTQEAANNAPRNPELAPAVAKTIIYPPSSIDARVWAGTAGALKGRAHRLFGRMITSSGYFYGDDNNAATMPQPTGEQHTEVVMPDVMQTHRTPASQPAESIDEFGAEVFSLSLQDVKAQLPGSDEQILAARRQNYIDQRHPGPAPDFGNPAKILIKDWEDDVAAHQANARV